MNPVPREVGKYDETRAKTSLSCTQRWTGRRRGREGGGRRLVTGTGGVGWWGSWRGVLRPEPIKGDRINTAVL